MRVSTTSAEASALERESNRKASLWQSQRLSHTSGNAYEYEWQVGIAGSRICYSVGLRVKNFTCRKTSRFVKTFNWCSGHFGEAWKVFHSASEWRKWNRGARFGPKTWHFFMEVPGFDFYGDQNRQALRGLRLGGNMLSPSGAGANSKVLRLGAKAKHGPTFPEDFRPPIFRRFWVWPVVWWCFVETDWCQSHFLVWNDSTKRHHFVQRVKM